MQLSITNKTIVVLSLMLLGSSVFSSSTFAYVTDQIEEQTKNGKKEYRTWKSSPSEEDTEAGDGPQDLINDLMGNRNSNDYKYGLILYKASMKGTKDITLHARLVGENRQVELGGNAIIDKSDFDSIDKTAFLIEFSPSLVKRKLNFSGNDSLAINPAIKKRVYAA